MFHVDGTDVAKFTLVLVLRPTVSCRHRNSVFWLEIMRLSALFGTFASVAALAQVALSQSSAYIDNSASHSELMLHFSCAKPLRKNLLNPKLPSWHHGRMTIPSLVCFNLQFWFLFRLLNARQML